MKVPALLKNKYVFYACAALAVLNVAGYAMVRAWECLALFGLTAYSAHCYSGNKCVAILAALFVANFVFGCGRVKEGIDETLKGPEDHVADAAHSAEAAVEGLAVSIAAEFAPNIRVNCVALSLTNSKIAQHILKNTAVAQGIAKAHPLKRLGEGKDGAALAKFLLTEESSWVTGQVIAVDGGRSKLS